MLAVAPRILLVLSLFLWLGACSRSPEESRSSAPEAQPRRVEAQYSYAQTNDLRVSPQLVSGWYEIEDGAWRWMAREAQVVLRSPERSPAEFEVRLALPRGHVAKTGPVQFSVLFNNQLFLEQTYVADGNYLLAKTVPPGMLTRDPVRVTLRVSKARAPVPGGDQRELGAVILGVGFK